jgi:hypothetical protein
MYMVPLTIRFDKMLYFSYPLSCTPLAHLKVLDLMNVVIFREQRKNMQFYAFVSLPLRRTKSNKE